MGKKIFSRQSKTSVFTAIIISCIFVIFYLFVMQENLVKEKEENAQIYAQSVISTLELSMERYIYMTEVMEHAYLQNGDLFFSQFETYGSWLVHGENAVTTAYFTDKGLLSHGYPSNVTQEIIKVDLFELEEQKDKAFLARDSKKTIIAGPLKVLEGYKGLIVRNPVYKNDEFVGFSIVVLNWEDYEKEVLQNLTKLDVYKIGVRKETSEENELLEDGYIFTTGKIMDTRIEVPFTLANEKMYLVIDRHDNWFNIKELLPNIWTAAFLVVVICFLVYFISRNDERRKQLEMERSSSEAMSRFLSNMSHDMRTPLNGIIGLLDINMKHSDNHELVYENDCKAYATSRHLLSLINNVLDMNKIASGTVEMEEVSFSMGNVLNDCSDMMRVQAEAAGIHLFLDYGEDNAYRVIGSPLHVKEILINIFSNAIKYNKKDGEVRAIARWTKKDENTLIYTFIIADTGIGMTREFLEKDLFKPFIQGENATHFQVVGTGLGMPIVKDLVSAMNGTIQIESQVGVGTAFQISIPFKIDRVYREEGDKEREILELTGMHILLVDDVELNLEIAQFILEEAGAEITIATNGKESIEEFEKHPEGYFDVILMDVIMPVMNGYDATQKIRELDRSDAKTVPIIALTANAFKEDMKKCLDAGMTDHISKPIDMDVFIAKLHLIHKRK